MAMPEDLVLVRHGQSEANIIQAAYKHDPLAEVPLEFFDRHDSRMRLSPLGREQAAQTGAWLLSQFPEGFDRYYTSPLFRAAETAGRLAIGGAWEPDDRWRERDWGEYGAVTQKERDEVFALSSKLRGQSQWYWCPPGGESLASGVSLRVKDIFGTLTREMSGKQVIAVTHGETIEVSRVILEKMMPETWLEQQSDPNYKLANCQVLHYSRRNPHTHELGAHLSWRRSVCAWDDNRSWQEGEWVEIPRKTYSDADLLGIVDKHPNLLPS